MGKDNKKEGNEEKLETKFEIVNSAQASAILFITCSPHRIDATYHWKNHHYQNTDLQSSYILGMQVFRNIESVEVVKSGH